MRLSSKAGFTLAALAGLAIAPPAMAYNPTPSSAPEPSTWAAFAFAAVCIVGLILKARRRRTDSAR